MKSILETVIKDIKALKGKKVKIFDQPQTLKKDIETLEINVIDLLENFKSYEIDINEIEMSDYIEYNSGNSYNWNSPLSNDINFTIYKKDNHNYIVACRIHRYGDVRSNYTNYFYLEFTHDTEFFEVLLEKNEYEYIDVDGVTYSIVVSVLSDTIEINSVDGGYIGEVCACDMNELKTEIRNLVH